MVCLLSKVNSHIKFSLRSLSRRNPVGAAFEPEALLRSELCPVVTGSPRGVFQTDSIKLIRTQTLCLFYMTGSGRRNNNKLHARFISATTTNLFLQEIPPGYSYSNYFQQHRPFLQIEGKFICICFINLGVVFIRYR